jgi:hypothetical protein
MNKDIPWSGTFFCDIDLRNSPMRPMPLHGKDSRSALRDDMIWLSGLVAVWDDDITSHLIGPLSLKLFMRHLCCWRVCCERWTQLKGKNNKNLCFTNIVIKCKISKPYKKLIDLIKLYNVVYAHRYTVVFLWKNGLIKNLPTETASSVGSAEIAWSQDTDHSCHSCPILQVE